MWGRRSERFVSLISIISISGVAIGVAALIVVLAVMSGFDKDLKEKIIGNYSHLVVEAHPAITDYHQILERLSKIEHIVASSPFIQSQALLETRESAALPIGRQTTALWPARGIVVRGIDLSLESGVTDINKYLSGAAKDFDGGVFIGKELGYALDLSLGDELVLVNSRGRRFSLLVKGLFNSGMYDFDANVIFTDLLKAQEIFELDKAVSGISIKIDKLFLADAVKNKIQDALGVNFYVRTWIERNRNFFAALKLEKIAMFIILTLIVLVAAFNIISTLVVMVTEKTKDIGILKAIGMTPQGIRFVFTLEGLLLGSLGIILGSGIGLSLCVLLKKYQFIKLPPDIYYLDRLPVSIVLWPDMGMVIIAAFFISLVSTVYPAKKASGLNPVEALRYE